MRSTVSHALVLCLGTLTEGFQVHGLALPATRYQLEALSDNSSDLGERVFVNASTIALRMAEAGLDNSSDLREQVFVNGEPKSGTNWLSSMLAAILQTACAKEKQCHLTKEQQSPTLPPMSVTAEMSSGVHSFTQYEKHFIPNVGHNAGFDFETAPALSASALHSKAQQTLERAGAHKKWAVVIRDPRDTTLSACHHATSGHCNDPDTWLRTRIEQATAWISLRYEFFKELQALAPQRVVVLFYEDMQRHPKAAIRSLRDLFGVPLDAHEVEEISKNTSFAVAHALNGWRAPNGKVCGFKDQLSRHAAESITSSMEKVLSAELRKKWVC